MRLLLSLVPEMDTAGSIQQPHSSPPLLGIIPSRPLISSSPSPTNPGALGPAVQDASSRVAQAEMTRFFMIHAFDAFVVHTPCSYHSCPNGRRIHHAFRHADDQESEQYPRIELQVLVEFEFGTQGTWVISSRHCGQEVCGKRDWCRM